MAEYNGYAVVNDGTFGMTLIQTIGQGGMLPARLQGTFTSPANAHKAIDAYVNMKKAIADKPAPVQKVKLTPRGD